MEDEFLTMKDASEGYYMERGSKFLSYLSPVSTENEAVLFLQKIKKDHPKARHYCTALRLYPNASLERSSDDGEPSGSAGRPILNQLIKNQLTNISMVVVRYFGGTKLGVPGLIEAYKTSASNAIAKGIIIRRKVYATVQLEMTYEQQPAFMNFCRQSDIPVFDEVFKELALITIGFKKTSFGESFIRALHNYSQMDFTSIEHYLKHLEMKAELIPEDRIL